MTSTVDFARPEQTTSPDGVDPTRAREVVRELFARQALTPRDLTAPLLVYPDGSDPGALPGSVTLSGIAETARRWSSLGIRGTKIFAFGSPRDARASGAIAPDNLMLAAIREVKSAAPELVVTTEVCGCSWTDHGECAILDGSRINLAATLDLMAEMALLHANAGADVVSPTAMLNGSVSEVRRTLTEAGMPDVGVCPNIALHTALYGPFKAAMGTNPGRGHRRGLQLEPQRAHREALTQAHRWLAEGADSLTLQPVMTAVDVLVGLRQVTLVPLIAYSTSGEYAALGALGIEGAVEYHAGLLRAGADLVLSFAAESVARTLA